MSLSHLDDEGRARMVDVSGKAVTARRAVAEGFVRLPKQTVAELRGRALPKGDALTVAELAGVMGAKRTADLIPMCHPLQLTNIKVTCSLQDEGVQIRVEVSTNAQTGVEMEAITAVSIAAVTIYDMCKSVDPDITITDIRLLEKSGGKREWRRFPSNKSS